MSGKGEAGVDLGGVVVVAEERLTDKFSQLIYLFRNAFVPSGLMTYTEQWTWDFCPQIRNPVKDI